ncbi:DEAD/DEAH box helicase, partial [Coleofasciculus sp. LEGE 07081]
PLPNIQVTQLQPTDYAAIIRAAKKASQQPPDFLAPGKPIRSRCYGTGNVVALLGNRLIVQFSAYSNPVHFSDWQQAVESGELMLLEASITPASVTNDLSQPSTEISLEKIQEIDKPEFREVATELASIITDISIIPAAPGQLYPIPEDVPPALKRSLQQVGITGLYGHQVEALLQLRSGRDLSLATPTASGKTLCYNLAVLESCLNQPRNCALYIFPLKALAYDQLRKLQRIVATLPSSQRLKVGQITGDTPYSDRKQLFLPHPPHILAVSPDLLHYQLEKVRRLEEWQPWREFLLRLHWVVIDEAHTYIGAFGAHFANLMRRLRRAVDSVGGNSDRLQFICSSATIGNPAEMARRFSGRTHQPERLHLIDTSEATASEQTILWATPSQTANPDACKIILSLLHHSLSGIVFCNSRAAVKNLIELVQRETSRQGVGYLAKKVAPFYGSLKGDRRRRLIQQLGTGEVNVIVSTSALEAGIDLPELDCCVIRGYPGSIMSFRQRLGRVGRQNPGLIIFLPVAQNPLDYYYGQYPQQLLSETVESAAFNPDYPTILSKHLECCCVESGLPLVEVELNFGTAGGIVASGLLEQRKLFLSSHHCLWASGYPHRGVNLRGNALSSVELVDISTGETFEEMSLEIAYREVFPGAIYTASDEGGNLVTYRCESLNLESNKALLQPLPSNPGIFTQAETSLEIQCLGRLEEPKIIATDFPEGRLRLRLNWGEITTVVKGYKILSRDYRLTCTNVTCLNYHQPLSGKACSVCRRQLYYAEVTQVKEEVPFQQPYRSNYQAPVVKVEINPGVVEAVVEKVNVLKSEIKAEYGNAIPDVLKELWTSSPDWVALHSLGHQIIFALPMVVLSSSQDVNCVVEKEDKRVVGYFFDTCDGGNGAAEAIFQQLPVLAAKAKSLASICDCADGCPRCLTQSGCPQQNAGLHKEVGLFLLRAIGSEVESA